MYILRTGNHGFSGKVWQIQLNSVKENVFDHKNHKKCSCHGKLSFHHFQYHFYPKQINYIKIGALIPLKPILPRAY